SPRGHWARSSAFSPLAKPQKSRSGRTISSCRANWRSIAFRAMVLAVEHIRRMRGGAQSHLMRCDDGGYYIVKFQNNPQHVRVLANEMLGTKLAGGLGLRVPQTEVVEVRRELVELTADLVIQLGTGRTPCRAGKQFGSRYPGDPAQTPVGIAGPLIEYEHARKIGKILHLIE